MTITGTLYEGLHIFVCTEVTGWEIIRLPWLPVEPCEGIFYDYIINLSHRH